VITTYAELVTAVLAWAKRTDVAALVADFIVLAEARISSDMLKSQALERVQQATITAGVAALPDNVIEVTGLRLVGATRPDVEVTSRERIQYLRERSYAGGGTTYAALVGRTFETYPATEGTLEIRARCRVPALSDAAPTNWVLTNHPNAYLFGALYECFDYVRDAESSTRALGRYDEAIAQAKRSIGYAGTQARAVPRGSTP
jgi:hypothetical protein